MTITSSPAQAFRVLIRDGDATIGRTRHTERLEEVRVELARMRRAYPDSALEALLPDGDLGSWQVVTEEDLDRMASVKAALTLANILGMGLPRISWTLHEFDPGRVAGQADTRKQVEEFARALLLEVTEDEHPTNVLVSATGAFQGVEVRVSCYVRREQPAEVSR